MSQPVILYVEDNPESREILQFVVEVIMGFEQLTVFEDSTDFEAKVATLDPTPTIILLDIHMTPYTGFEMLKMVRADTKYQDIPVIALTASVMSEEVKELKDAGFDGVIAKPLDVDRFPNHLEAITKGEKLWNITD
ncbi:MAG: response regulator [Chloroflexota bacterium]